MKFITTHVMPEFLTSDQPIDGDRYALAELAHDSRINIYNEHPRYEAQSNRWVFSTGTRPKHDEDCWLPERQYLELAELRALHTYDQ